MRTSREYEKLREELLDAEAALRDQRERVAELRRALPTDTRVDDHDFREAVDGVVRDVRLSELFSAPDRTLVLMHFMYGKKQERPCPMCTLWADGFNGFLPHLENALSVVLVSKDDPQTQRRFANSRGWRFRLASHGGGDYIREQTVMAGADNMPGAVVFERRGHRILRKNAAIFGPGDRYCSLWGLLGLAGLGESDWTPQYNYWQRPAQLDDGGANLLD